MTACFAGTQMPFGIWDAILLIFPTVSPPILYLVWPIRPFPLVKVLRKSPKESQTEICYFLSNSDHSITAILQLTDLVSWQKNI